MEKIRGGKEENKEGNIGEDRGEKEKERRKKGKWEKRKRKKKSNLVQVWTTDLSAWETSALSFVQKWIFNQLFTVWKQQSLL